MFEEDDFQIISQQNYDLDLNSISSSSEYSSFYEQKGRSEYEDHRPAQDNPFQ